MKYKLVVSDIDGTLIDSNRCISKRTKNAIEQFQKRGGIFTFATGRIEDSARKYYEELSLRIPAILYNGAKIVNIFDNESLYEDSLHQNHANEALNIIKDYQCDTLVYYKGKAYVSKINDVIEKYMEKDNINCIALENIAGYGEDAPTKILIIGDKSDFVSLQERLVNTCDPRPNIVRSEETYLEILPIGVTKGSALKKLCELLGISINSAVAIGDNLNDMEMVSMAGLGVAVENAHPDLKKVAKYVTRSNNEDGVAEVLEMIVKGEL